ACLADLEAGRAVDAERLAAEHAASAERLQTCLATLNLVQQAAAGLGPGDARVPPERRLGDFDILREVGRGGMGVVYEARQVSLGRRVALKVLPFAATLDPRQLQRFWMEAQAAAILHHAHVVPVYSVGSERGVHYYAMQFIEGQNLAALIKDLRRHSNRASKTEDRRSRVEAASTAAVRQAETQRIGDPRSSILDPRSSDFFRAVARLGVQAAEALEHAHQLGVIHRDVKPANLLVDATGNVWITDFAPARLRPHAALTLTGTT